MRYFARLREQSGLNVLAEETARPIDRWSDAPGAADELEITEFQESLVADDMVARAPLPRKEATVTSALPAPAADTEPLITESVLEEPSAALPAESSHEIHALLPAPRAAESDLDVDAAAGTLPMSAEATLRQVLEWIAAAPPSADEPEGRQIEPDAHAQATPPERVPAPAVRPIAMSPSEPLGASHSEARARTLPASQAEPVKVESVDPQRERLTHETVAVLPSTERAGADADVEEMLTVSIGAIHVRVEMPAPAPPAVPRPTAPTRPAREPRRAAPRLARHYLRP